MQERLKSFAAGSKPGRRREGTDRWHSVEVSSYTTTEFYRRPGRLSKSVVV